MKKFLLYLSTISLSVFVFLAGVYFIGKKQISQTNKNELLLANNSLIARFNSEIPEKVTKPIGPVKFSNETGSALTLSPNGKLAFFYSPDSGQIRYFELTDRDLLDLADSKIAYQLKKGLIDIQWSSDQKEIIAKLAGKYVYFDLNNGKFKTLPQNISNIAFAHKPSGNGYNTVYYSSENDGGIYISDLKNDSTKKIMNTGYSDWQFDWSVQGKISLLNSYNLLLLDPDSGSLEKIIKNEPVSNLKWSPDGNQLIFLSQGSLKLFNLKTKTETDLDTTFDPENCLWIGDYIYCYDSDSFSFFNPNKTPIEVKKIADNPFGLNISDFTINTKSGYLLYRDLNSSKFYGSFITSEL
jgi:hypothetical protein